MNYADTPHAEMDAAIARAEEWARRLSDGEIAKREEPLRGRYLDRMSPRQWAILFEAKRRGITR